MYINPSLYNSTHTVLLEVWTIPANDLGYCPGLADRQFVCLFADYDTQTLTTTTYLISSHHMHPSIHSNNNYYGYGLSGPTNLCDGLKQKIGRRREKMSPIIQV